MANTEYIKQVRYSDGQLRVEIDTEAGDVTRFLVQLERLVDGEPNVVARFDHDQDGEQAHDITEEGLHLDVYRDGEKHRVERGFPPVRLSAAVGYYKTYLEKHADRYLRRFDQWHNLTT